MAEADLIARVEDLLEEADPRCLEVASALLELYGAGLERLVGHVAAHDRDGAMAAAVAGDELVGHLLLVHGLHPVPVRERVLGALDEVGPLLGTHGGGVELLGIEDGVVRLQLEGSCSGCPSSTVTLKHAIETAILKAAPDVERIEAIDAPKPADAPLLQIETVCPLPMAP